MNTASEETPLPKKKKKRDKKAKKKKAGKKKSKKGLVDNEAEDKNGSGGDSGSGEDAYESDFIDDDEAEPALGLDSGLHEEFDEEEYFSDSDRSQDKEGWSSDERE